MRFDRYDAELRHYQEVLRGAVPVEPHDHVLDIGCGTGQTTRDVARAARSGRALGVDVSAAAVDRAREHARNEGLGNVTFELADAQVHEFPPARFDRVISRFGTMFFADPVAAFANIGRALRPGGHLAMLVWQAADRNEWDVTLREALGTHSGPAPFSLADPAHVRRVLGEAGFADLAVTDVHKPIFFGTDVADAEDWVRGFTSTSEALDRLEPAAATRALDRLRTALSEHLTDGGVRFESRAWLVTARRP